MTGQSKRCSLFLFSLFAAVAATAGHKAAADDSYFYSGGTRHPLPVSSQWMVVQLDKDGQAADAANAIKARGALDTTRAVRQIRRFNLAVVPLKNANSEAARNTVRGSLETTKQVRRVFRAFGSGQSPIIETDEFVVQFKAGTDKAAAARILAEHGAVLVAQLGSYAPNGYRARVTDAGLTATEVANELYESGLTQFSHPNLIWPKQRRFLPNDTYFPQQWYLRNTGQSGGTAGVDIGAELAWNITRGSGVTVGILDDGFDQQHEDLAANMLPGYDFEGTNGVHDSDPSPGPGDGHGTAVAGLVAAVSDNGKGISGIAPQSKILPVRMIGDDITDQDEADAFEWAVDHGARVISNSWGPQDGLGISQPLPDITRAGIHFAATDFAGDGTHPQHKGAVIFWAAGNGNESADLDGYASNPEVISVAASTRDGSRAYYSDYGSSVDLNAPGGAGDMVTTDNTGSTGFSLDKYYTQFSGTSAAAPLAAGVAALMLSVDPSLTRQQIQTILQNTADKNGVGYDSNGHSDQYGYGRVNAYRALKSLSKYSVSGRVTTAGGNAVAGVTVTSSTGATTTTDSSGNYTLASAGTGATTLTPSLADTIFTPASTTLTLAANATGVNFSALNYTVSLITPANNSTVNRPVSFVGRTNNNDTGTSRMDFQYRGPNYTDTTNANIAIPDAPDDSGQSTTAVTSSYTNSRVGHVQSATVSVDITHSFVPDLVVSLISPDGQTFVLQNQGYNSTGGIQDLKQSYALQIGSTLPTIKGLWQLKVVDVESGDSGTLNSWSIQATPAWELAASDTDGATGGNWTATWTASSAPPGSYQMRAVGTYSGQTFPSPASAVTISTAPVTQSISGQITAGGLGVAGITVARTGSTQTVVTDAQGNYTFPGLAGGSYTVTPAPNDTYKAFTPASRQVTVASADVTAVNFTSVASLQITGRIISGPSGIPGVMVKRSGSTGFVRTDAQGYYTFPDLTAGNYTITPAATGVFQTFTPASRSVTLAGSSVTDVNFTAPLSLHIAGRIITGNTGIPGVVVKRSGSTGFVRTDAQGYYSFGDLAPGDYTITPSPTGAFTAFTPDSKAVTVGINDVANVNFSAPLSLKITGRIITGNTGIPGIYLTRSGSSARAITDAQGYYSFTGLTPGTYTVTPTPAGSFTAFTPTSTSVTLGFSDAVNVNFSAPLSLRISGKINSGGVGLASVYLSRSDSTAKIKTDAAGNFSLIGLTPGTYTITPEAIGAFQTFTPASRTITVTTTDFTLANFTAPLSLHISGRVSTGGVGIPNVMVKRSGSTGFVRTDASGNFTFGDLPPGTYTITPAATGAFTSFTPVSRSVTVTTADFTLANFTAPLSLHISGTITDGGIPIPNVVVKRSGWTGFVRTDSSGNYTFGDLVPGDYTITPSGTDDYPSFTPASRDVSVVANDLVKIDFSGVAAGVTTKSIASAGSSVQLSSVSATADGVIKLIFTRTLAASAANPDLYTTAAGIESAGVKDSVLTLSVPDGSWHRGDKVSVAWHGVRDSQGLPLADGSVTATVR